MDTGNPLPIAKSSNASVEAQVKLSKGAKRREEAVSDTILEGVKEAAQEIRAKEKGVGAALNVEA